MKLPQLVCLFHRCMNWQRGGGFSLLSTPKTGRREAIPDRVEAFSQPVFLVFILLPTPGAAHIRRLSQSTEEFPCGFAPTLDVFTPVAESNFLCVGEAF